MIPAFCEHSHVDDDLNVTFLKGAQNITSVSSSHVSIDHVSVDAVGYERIFDIAGMIDRGAKDHRLAISGLFFPMADYRLGNRRLVHNGVDRLHIEVIDSLAHAVESVLGADVDHKGTWWDQMAGSDQLTNGDLVRHVRENRTQAFFVTPVGRGGDAKDANVGIAITRPINDPPVAVGSHMMRFIDDQKIQRWHGVEICCPRQCWHHGEGGPPPP